MAKIEFKMKLPATSKKLYDLCTDFENHKKAFPSQLKNIEIIEEDEFKITTKEILVFNTYFKKDQPFILRGFLNKTILEEYSFNNCKTQQERVQTVRIADNFP